MTEQGNEKKLVHTMTIPVRWGDMDALGHVNNTVYFRYMEQARIEWLAAMGCLPDENGNGPVIVSARCDFRKPLTYPDQVEVCTYIYSLGKSSFETAQEMRSVNDGYAVYAEGGATVVWVDSKTGKGTPFPDAIRTKYAELKGDQQGRRVR